MHLYHCDNLPFCSYPQNCSKVKVRTLNAKKRKKKKMPEFFYLLLLPLRKISWSREKRIGEFSYHTKAVQKDVMRN